MQSYEKKKINELPQLLNIIKGDLSLIGPRPVTPDHFEMYEEGAQKIISSIRPGLSGIGSIIFRSEEVLMPQNPDERAEFTSSIFHLTRQNWKYGISITGQCY